MLYLRNLGNQLKERKDRLYGAGATSYDSEIKYLLQFLDGNLFFSSLLTELEANASVDFYQWDKQLYATRELQFPETEEGRAKLCYGCIRQWASDGGTRIKQRWFSLLGSHSVDSVSRDFTQNIVEHFVNFLLDKTATGGSVLYLIERYKIKVEWYRQKKLYDLYIANTTQGEKSLDCELRADLFEGGVDYPLSQPLSPSGKADIVALLGSPDPLVLEVKVFDPKNSKGKGNLSQGFHQVLSYANDYNESIGYLVVFNCSASQLVISPEGDSSIEFPPRIAHAGKMFFVIPIDVNPETESASKERPDSRVTITSKYLIGNPGTVESD